MQLPNEQYSDTNYNPSEQAAGMGETENPYEFETAMLNPASRKKHDWLTRDAVLSNLTSHQLLEIRIGLELVQILDYLGLDEAKDAFLSDINSLLVVSRGVDGFWTRMMRTSISELKGWKQEDVEKKGFRWLFQRKKQ